MFELLEPMLRSKLFWISALIASIYLYLKYVVFSYWKGKSVPHEEPTLLVGNLLPAVLEKQSIGNCIKENYEKFNKYPFHGIYLLHIPALVINDPDLIRSILVKEFSRFRDRASSGFDEKVNPLTNHLFFLGGEKWRRLRSKLSPTFSSGKLKVMFPLLKNIGDELGKTVDEALKKDNIVEIKDLLARYTTDTIASIAFGLQSNSLKISESEFRIHGRMIIESQTAWRAILFLFAPHIINWLRVPIIKKKVFNFFTGTFFRTVEYRRKEKVVRHDFLNLLMQLVDHGVVSEDDESNNTVDSNDKLTLMEACAQAFVFFLAGFETSSSTVTYCLYELALNPDIQDKLREEIDEFLKRHDGFSYKNILREMKYLDMVFNETLRKHPSLPFLTRVCEQKWNIPNSDYCIPKGMLTLIPVSGIMRNPEFYPDPDKFDPERFTKENVDRMNPFTHLPFGHGPRICIGNRFGILQTKVALVSVLSKFKFSPCKKTSISINYTIKTFLQAPSNGVYLKVERR